MCRSIIQKQKDSRNENIVYIWKFQSAFWKKFLGKFFEIRFCFFKFKKFFEQFPEKFAYKFFRICFVLLNLKRSSKQHKWKFFHTEHQVSIFWHFKRNYFETSREKYQKSSTHFLTHHNCLSIFYWFVSCNFLLSW